MSYKDIMDSFDLMRNKSGVLVENEIKEEEFTWIELPEPTPVPDDELELLKEYINKLQ